MKFGLSEPGPFLLEKVAEACSLPRAAALFQLSTCFAGRMIRLWSKTIFFFLFFCLAFFFPPFAAVGIIRRAIFASRFCLLFNRRHPAAALQPPLMRVTSPL